MNEPIRIRFTLTFDFGKGKLINRDCISERGMVAYIKEGFSNPSILGINVRVNRQ